MNKAHCEKTGDFGKNMAMSEIYSDKGGSLPSGWLDLPAARITHPANSDQALPEKQEGGKRGKFNKNNKQPKNWKKSQTGFAVCQVGRLGWGVPGGRTRSRQ